MHITEVVALITEVAVHTMQVVDTAAVVIENVLSNQLLLIINSK